MPKSKKDYSPTSSFQRLQNKFPNFLLGLTVVVLALLLGSIFLQNRELGKIQLPQRLTELFKPKPTAMMQDSTRAYKVKEGDSLWSIAEAAYGSGFNAFEIAKANNLENPDALPVGITLSLPSMESKEPTQGEIASGVYTTAVEQANESKGTYTIQEGDSLWSIALKKYGNPYKWSELCEKNNRVMNPDLIYAGETLTLLY